MSFESSKELEIKPHPETQEDEVFWMYASRSTFRKIKWRSKRLGNNAYAADGKTVIFEGEIFPVFLMKKELFEAGYSLIF